MLTRQVLFAQPIGGVWIPFLRCPPQPPETFVRVMHLRVPGQEQLAQGVLGLRHPTLHRLMKPIPRFSGIWDQQRAVPIELAHDELGVNVPLLCQPLQPLHPLIPEFQGLPLIQNELPEFLALKGHPAIIRLLIHSLHLLILKGGLPQPEPLCLPDDGVLDLPELLLLGQFLPRPGAVVIVAVYLVLKHQPLVIALFHHRQLLQFIHNLVHRFLHWFWQVAVGLLALGSFQLHHQFLHYHFRRRAITDPVRHLPGKL